MLQKGLTEVTTQIMDRWPRVLRRIVQCEQAAEPEWVRHQAGTGPNCGTGLRPPQPVSSEPGEWQRGWQYHASSPLEHHFRETVIFVQSDAVDRAHFKVEPHLSHTVVLEPLRLPPGDRSVVRLRSEVGHLRQTWGSV